MCPRARTLCANRGGVCLYRMLVQLPLAANQRTNRAYRGLPSQIRNFLGRRAAVKYSPPVVYWCRAARREWHSLRGDRSAISESPDLAFIARQLELSIHLQTALVFGAIKLLKNWCDCRRNGRNDGLRGNLERRFQDGSFRSSGDQAVEQSDFDAALPRLRSSRNRCVDPASGVWLFTSRLGNSPVTRSKPIWLDVTIVTP